MPDSTMCLDIAIDQRNLVLVLMDLTFRKDGARFLPRTGILFRKEMLETVYFALFQGMGTMSLEANGYTRASVTLEHCQVLLR